MKKTKAELNSIGLLAPLVMAQRLSRMMLPEHMKTSNDHAEDRRMLDEKTKAASDGFIAANVELSHQMMDAWVGMAFAALKPSRIKVTANAKRLTGKKK
jgi:ribonuclease I